MPKRFIAAWLVIVVTGAIASSQGPQLVEAVRAGNREAVRALLKGGAKVNVGEADGTTPLHWAVRNNDLETVRALLAAGADANAANRYGTTPLVLAATNGNAPITLALLASGADPNRAAARGQTPLMTAAHTGNAATVKALLDRGAVIDAREEALGETALMWAAAEDHSEVVSLLIARGADPDARSTSLTFPKDRFGLEGVLTILPRGGWTPLMYAARDGAPKAARALAKGKANLNAVDPEGTSALVRAIMNAHYDTAAVLIEEGANPNIADSAGMAALYAAVDMSSLGEVYGRPARPVKDTRTVLDVIELLLAHGADANARLLTPTLQRNHTPGEGTLGEGTTPLMRAARNGDYRAMEILLAHGADIALTQKNGSTALMQACGYGRGLSAFAEDVGSEADLFKAAEMLIDRGADVNVTNDTGSTPLHYAGAAGLNSVVRLLARRGATLDAKDRQGRTPADTARGVGGRGRAGGPAIMHHDTAALIEELIAARAEERQ